MSGWTAILPVAPVRLAKSRLDLKSHVRMQFALASALDVVDALRAADDVEHVVVVTCDAQVGARVAGFSDVVVLQDRPLAPDGGHAGALRVGSVWARSRRPRHPVLTLPADLASLSPKVLEQVLPVMVEHPLSFVADAEGCGTTLTGFVGPVPIQPLLGPGSAASHRAMGFREVEDADPRARLDVDDLDQLRRAVELGVGPRVTDVLETYRVSLEPRRTHPLLQKA